MSEMQEYRIWRTGGLVPFILELALVAGIVGAFFRVGPITAVWQLLAAAFIAVVCTRGFFVVQPNEAKAFTFFGSYAGSAREQGFYFTNPLTKRKSISLRVRNFASQKLKVNDFHGNPIEIAAVVVWRVADSAKALFAVEDYESFVTVQSETALRYLAGRFPYDSVDSAGLSLRGSQDEVARELKEQLAERLAAAGIEIDEARLSHLAYAPEIAQAMLRRQQADAIIAARRLIVDGAVGMVKLALGDLEAQGVVQLDNERRAAMVNNLLVALVSETEAKPVINTGSLYS